LTVIFILIASELFNHREHREHREREEREW